MLRPILVTGFSLLLLTWYLPGMVIAEDNYSDPEFWIVLGITAVVVTFLFKIVQPVLKILTLPINIVTLGLFSAVITVGLLWLSVYLVPSFDITEMVVLGVSLNQFFSLLFVAILLGFVQSIFRALLK